jgi:hypothetical protein
LVFAIAIYEQVLNFEMSALAAWQVTAMDITFVMQVHQMQKSIRTLT